MSLHRALAPALLLLALAACGSGSVRDRGRPTPADGLVATAHDHLDVIGREPMVVEHPDGTLFVAGYGQPSPTLWRSGDRGATWSRVAVGDAAAGALGNSDVDLAVAADGTLYFASMVYDREANEGVSVSVGTSR